MSTSKNLFVHFERLVKETESILEISRLHVAIAKHGQYVRVILLRYLKLCKQLPIQFQSSGEVIKSLFKIFILKICLTEFGVSSDKNEKVFLVDIDQ